MHSLAHRGPDDEGIREFAVRFRTAGGEGAATTVLLGARRLAIIDLTDSAHQPMCSPDDRFHIVFNGEIYNFPELRSELQHLGWQFRTKSDTEVLLAGYQAWGEDVVRRLVGMFSFAILDTVSATLFLARDPFGIKPLYYARARGSFIFCSEIAPLLEFPSVSRRVNVRRLYEFISDGVTDYSGETMFADVFQLPAAHSMTVSSDRTADAVPAKYWTVRSGQAQSSADAAERYRELFAESVKLHLRSDVPVGISFSGGIDSSAIVGIAHQLNGNGNALSTISYIADDPAVSEQRWCDAVARSIPLQQHIVRIDAEELARDFASLVRIQEQPFGSPTIYAQYRIFKAAREAGLKVMLGGHGADQYIGSYHPHLAVRFASLMRQGHPLKAAHFMHRASLQPGARGFLTWRAGMRHVAPEPMVRLSAQKHRDANLPVTRGWFESHGVDSANNLRVGRFNSLHDLLADTLLETNLPALLRIEDRNAMAFSIENRVPFLTTALVDFVFSLPEEELIDADGTCKSVLLRAMEGVVPKEILARRDKLGFFMPMQKLAHQLAPWARGIFNDLSLVPALDPARASAEAEAVFRSVNGSRNTQPLIWRWLSLIAWAREFNVQFD